MSLARPTPRMVTAIDVALHRGLVMPDLLRGRLNGDRAQLSRRAYDRRLRALIARNAGLVLEHVVPITIERAAEAEPFRSGRDVPL
jgi:hypothetical protein